VADRDDPAGAMCGFYADVTGYVNKFAGDFCRSLREVVMVEPFEVCDDDIEPHRTVNRKSGIVNDLPTDFGNA
jgi:hypothetical protein